MAKQSKKSTQAQPNSTAAKSARKKRPNKPASGQGRYKVIREENSEITVIEPGVRYSIRIRLRPDIDQGGTHKSWHFSKSRDVWVRSLAEARTERDKYRHELEQGLSTIDMTVAQFARQWQDDRILQSESSLRSTGVAKPSKRTLERDEPEIRRIEQRFPTVTVRKLTVEHVERVISKMRDEGVSEHTIWKMFKKLRQILKRPAISGAIRHNPCDLVTNISEPKGSKETKDNRRITYDSASTFISWLSDQELDGRIVALWLGLTEQLRLGEALALRWTEVDFANNRIQVIWTLDKSSELVPAKAESGRALAMGSHLKRILLDWREMQKEQFPNLVKKWRRQKIPCGKKWDENAPVCSSYYGTHINPDNFGRWMRPTMVDLGLGRFETEEKWIDSRGIERVKRKGYRGVSYKSLRTFGTTLLVNKNLDLITVQKHDGHHSPETTTKFYAEHVPESERTVAAAVDGFLDDVIAGDSRPPEHSESEMARIINELDPAQWPGWVVDRLRGASR